MGQQTESAKNKNWKRRRFVHWLMLTAAIFSGLLFATQFLPGGRRSFSDWIPAVLFLLFVSGAMATAVVGAWLLIRSAWKVFRDYD
jgi:hypothetical protein